VKKKRKAPVKLAPAKMPPKKAAAKKASKKSSKTTAKKRSLPGNPRRKQNHRPDERLLERKRRRSVKDG
jgi:hypothetical protein